MKGVTIPVKRAILIAGPTASGKSAVAAALAEALGGDIINADSMQVYRDLRILTARPSEIEEARVPHRLFGHIDAAIPYSVGAWLEEVSKALREADETGRIPVLVGGTGLYIKALTQGLSAIPDVPATVRDRLRQEAGVSSPADLHQRLAACDPEMASRLRPTDPQRVLRALEVFEATGVSLSAYQQRRTRPLLEAAQIAGVFLNPPRSTLYARIDSRFDAMIEAGALDEVAALADRNLDPALPAMRALGVPDLIKGLSGVEPLETAVKAAKQATRHYSRRQLTFARHQLPWLPWTEPARAEAILRDAWAGDSS